MVSDVLEEKEMFLFLLVFNSFEFVATGNLSFVPATASTFVICIQFSGTTTFVQVPGLLTVAGLFLFCSYYYVVCFYFIFIFFLFLLNFFFSFFFFFFCIFCMHGCTGAFGMTPNVIAPGGSTAVVLAVAYFFLFFIFQVYFKKKKKRKNRIAAYIDIFVCIYLCLCACVLVHV